jgi:tRNA threonylcarbamoyl adenosine modification protein YjeE
MTTPVLRRVMTSEAQTVAAGRDLAGGLAVGDLLALHGELGAGKTCLVRGIAAGLGADPSAVRSPTFVLHQVYRHGRIVLHHIDLYRLGAGADLSVVDIGGLLEEGVVAVEWAGYADLRPHRPVHITIESPQPASRVLCLDAAAPQRIVAALTSSPTQT